MPRKFAKTTIRSRQSQDVASGTDGPLPLPCPSLNWGPCSFLHARLPRLHPQARQPVPRRNGTKPSFQASRRPPVETIGRLAAWDQTAANRLQGQKAVQERGTKLMTSRCNGIAFGWRPPPRPVGQAGFMNRRLARRKRPNFDRHNYLTRARKKAPGSDLNGVAAMASAAGQEIEAS